jgi:HEPN domain-containing protein
LYQTDFIQLIHFLSGKIKTSDVKGLLENINKAKDISELSLDELKSYIPTNNWDKYFSDIVEFEWEYFEKDGESYMNYAVKSHTIIF